MILLDVHVLNTILDAGQVRLMPQIPREIGALLAEKPIPLERA